MQFYVMLDEELLLRLYERTVAFPFRYLKVEPNWIATHSASFKLLIADPMLNEGAFEACSTLLIGPTSWSLLCYTRFSADTTSRLVALARIGFFRLVLFDHGDTPEMLCSALADEESQATSRQVLRLIDPEVQQLNERLRGVVSDLFRSPCRYHATYDLAFAARVSKASLYRTFRSAGLCSPKHLIVAARVARLAGGAIVGCQSFAAASKWAGYSDPRAIRSELRLTLRCTLQSLRLQSETDVVGQLAHFATFARGRPSDERQQRPRSDVVMVGDLRPHEHA